MDLMKCSSILSFISTGEDIHCRFKLSNRGEDYINNSYNHIFRIDSFCMPLKISRYKHKAQEMLDVPTDGETNSENLLT